MKEPIQKEKKNKRKSKPKQPETVQVTPTPWLDRITGIWSQFDRFGWDVFGIGLMAAAALTLLGLAGLSKGAFMTPWVSFLRHWMGWGSYLVIISIGIIGLIALSRHFMSMPTVRIGRILAIEGWVFSTLALLSIAGGHLLSRAEAGEDGGLIGWGLAELLRTFVPAPFDVAIWAILFLLFLAIATGFLQLVGKWIEKWLEEAPATVPELVTPVPTQAAVPDQQSVPTAGRQDPVEKPARRARAPRLPVIDESTQEVSGQKRPRDGHLPPLNLLLSDSSSRPDQDSIHATALLLERTLQEFGVPATVIGYRQGPTVTQYAVKPGFIEKPGPDGAPIQQKVRVSQISGLAKDLARALAAERLRIEAPVPGHDFVGIEVPNANSAMVRLRSILESDAFQKMSEPLAMALGKDVSGLPVVADLSKMPHMLVAGTTGSGKSVCIAAITVCLVMNNTPNELRLAMLDPKMVELVRFNGLPHLFGKVETQPDRMLGVLKWAIQEMDSRYKLLEAARARNLDTYNRRMEKRNQPTLPRIVLVIDELADLMMAAPDQTEHSLVRLAQLARATGIHLIVATQRPSTDVITGLIKANFPARIAFAVASGIDSRVILDTNGAESLLGRGDMLFLNPEVGSPTRAQGVIVTDQEIDRIKAFWQKMTTVEAQDAPWEELVENEEAGPDKLIEEAIKIVRRTQRASASMLQRRLRIGYPRAARLIDELEEMGVIGPAQAGGREREVLVPPDDEDMDGEELEGNE